MVENDELMMALDCFCDRGSRLTQGGFKITDGFVCKCKIELYEKTVPVVGEERVPIVGPKAELGTLEIGNVTLNIKKFVE